MYSLEAPLMSLRCGPMPPGYAATRSNPFRPEIIKQAILTDNF